MTTLKDLYPSYLWQNFEAITRIPRPSKKEEKIIAFLIDFAKINNLEFKKDVAGNLLICKPASENMKNARPVVLQSHVDMVCEKNSDVVHNFDVDPLQVYIDGDWVKARGTTLGADDGIGVAAMMAVLSDTSIQHGPLECLFTVDEETGLTGAFELEPGFFRAKTLLNLDSEDEGELFIGCAGGIDTTAVFTYTTQQVLEPYKGFLVSVTGLLGGHSGDEIHKNRGNAVKIMTSFLLNVMENLDGDLHRFEGGNLKNAIPREAFASLLIHPSQEIEFIDMCRSFEAKIAQDLALTDAGFKFMVNVIPSPETKIKKDIVLSMLKALNHCPHGVINWSKDIPDLVETSTNLASVKFKNGNQVVVTTSQRSSVESEKLRIASHVAETFRHAGAEISHSKGYPGWTPDLDSRILHVTAQAYKELFGEDARIKAIHAGLECGLFLEKYHGLDMISFGPTIKGAHSPDERLHIPSVTKFWDLLLTVLKRV